jgi:hypothetical protein
MGLGLTELWKSERHDALMKRRYLEVQKLMNERTCKWLLKVVRMLNLEILLIVGGLYYTSPLFPWKFGYVR